MQAKHGLLANARELWREMSANNVSDMAAALSYRFLLALFPFFIFVAAFGSFVARVLNIDNPAVEIVNRLGTALPGDARTAIEAQLNAVLQSQHPGLLSVGVLGALWAAAGGMTATINAMNRAYDVEESRPFWKRTAVALGLTLFTGLFFLVAFVLALAGQALISAIANAVGLGDVYRTVAGVIRVAGVVVLLLTAVAVLYWAGPSLRLPFRLITPGALLFLVAWIVGSAAFAFYVSHFGSYNATYGALGGVVVLMIWFYLTAYVLLAGAELNALLARHVATAQMTAASRDALQEAHQTARQELRFARTRVGEAMGSALALAIGWRATGKSKVEAQHQAATVLHKEVSDG